MSAFTLILDSDSTMPMYQQLYGFIKDEIKTGNLQSGEKLPSKRSLSDHLKISQSTVETAYGQLVAEGYIQSVPKSGYYVNKLETLTIPPVKSEIRKTDTDPVYTKQYRYDFRTNTVDTASFPFGTWARIVKEIMRDENRELLHAAHPQGDSALRGCIAKYLHAYRGVHCTEEQIVIGAGTEYLFGLIIQLLGQNAVYAVENPGYAKTHRILMSYGRRTNCIGMDEMGICSLALERSDSSVVYTTPSHHFPLGIVMPVNRRMQLLKWANKQEGRYIIEDDYDSEFRFSGRLIPSLQGLDAHNKVIYLGTFSKSLAPSIRISYLVLPSSLLDSYRENLFFYSSTVSRFEQMTLCRFIRNGHYERHVNRMRILYRGRKDKLVQEIRKLPFAGKIEIVGENAGLHLLLRIHASVSERDLVLAAESRGVKLYGLSEFYIGPKTAMPHSTVVLGYADFDFEEIEKAVSLIQAAWSQLL